MAIGDTEMLHSFQRASAVREFFTIGLVALLAFPPAVFAGDTPAPLSGSTAQTQVEDARLTSYAQATQFANSVLERAREEAKSRSLPDGTTLRAQIVHLEGTRISPYFQWVLKYLDHASIQVGQKTVNIEVEGSIVTAQGFRQAMEDFEKGITTDDAIAAYRLNYKNTTGEEPSERFDSLSLWTNVKTALQWFSDKAFGAPYGPTFFSCFAQKVEVVGEDGVTKSSYRWRFQPDASVTKLARSVTAVGLTWIVGMRIIGGWLTRPDAQGWDRITDLGALGTSALHSFYDSEKGVNLEFLAILAVVGVWVYTILTFSREVDLVRRTGREVKQDPSAAPGKQITMVANDRGYLAACTGQECGLNALILITQSYFGTATWGLWALVGKLFNGTLAAFSYLAMEEIRGGMLQEAERLRHTDPEKAAKLDASALRLGKFFWNIPFPIANNSAQFLSGWWTKLPLVILGGAGFGYRTWKRLFSSRESISPSSIEAQSINTPETLASGGVPCGDLLVIRAHRPDDRE
jgi:hypothetical protein